MPVQRGPEQGDPSWEQHGNHHGAGWPERGAPWLATSTGGAEPVRPRFWEFTSAEDLGTPEQRHPLYPLGVDHGPSQASYQ